MAYISLATDPQRREWQLVGRRRGELRVGVGGAGLLLLPINLLSHHLAFRGEWEVVVHRWPSATGRVLHRQIVPSEHDVEASMEDVARRITTGDLRLSLAR